MLEGPESRLRGQRGQGLDDLPEGPMGLPEGPECLPDGPRGLPRGSQGPSESMGGMDIWT